MLLNAVLFFLIVIILFISNFTAGFNLPEFLMNWAAYFSIKPSYLFVNYFKIDPVNIVFLMVLAFLYLGVSIYNVNYIKESGHSKRRLGLYSILFMTFVYSMLGVILSTHLALLWVFIEASTLATTYLIYFEKTKSSLEAAWKYIFICSIGISLAFVGIILLSIGIGKNSSLFFDDLYKNAKFVNPFFLKISFAFILVGFGTKMGLAPIHAWLPDAHSESPSTISSLLSGTLLNTAFLGILRVFKINEMAGNVDFAKIILLIMGFLSLLVSAVFIMRINNYKRMLAYSSIENMGIIAIGIGTGGLAFYASILHLILHSFIKSSFFLTSGNIYQLYKTKNINLVIGLLKKDKITGWLWIFSFLCISGIPPFPIFISEFLMIKAMFENNLIIFAVIFILLLTIIMFGLAKVVFKMSFGESMNKEKSKYLNFTAYLPQIIIIILLLVLGVYIPDIINSLIKNAALSL